MKIFTKASLALAGGLLLAAPSADAATVFLQAASGHPFLTSGVATWTDTWAAGTGPHGFFKINDGRSIFIQSPSAGSRVATWVVPIPSTGSNQNWTAVARGTGSAISHRICSFTSNGTFSNCGGSVSFNTTTTVLVPTDGTAFSQVTITATFPNDSGTLVSIRANN